MVPDAEPYVISLVFIESVLKIVSGPLALCCTTQKREVSANRAAEAVPNKIGKLGK
jgi:hypothetical protein